MLECRNIRKGRLKCRLSISNGRNFSGHIVLANPPKNLIELNFSNALKQAVHEASESDVRALLVRAEGPNFSQGGDVLDFLEKDTN